MFSKLMNLKSMALTGLVYLIPLYYMDWIFRQLLKLITQMRFPLLLMRG